MSELNPHDHEANQDARITALEATIKHLTSRVVTLETALIANNDALTSLQRTLVELTADHIERLFSDQVMVDSLAQRFLIAGANAIAFKASKSKQRTPQLVAIEAQIPGCNIRAKLTEEGGLYLQMQDKEGLWQEGDELPEDFRQEAVTNSIGNLLASYGAEIGRFYYVIDDIALEEFRNAAAIEAKANLDKVTGVGQEPTPAETEDEAPAGEVVQ